MVTKIRQFRQARGMSQRELAKQIGVCQSYMSEIETGRKFTSFKALYKMSKIFGCDIQELIDDQLAARQKRVEVEDFVESIGNAESRNNDNIVTRTVTEELQEEHARIGETILMDIMNGLQTLQLASRKKVLTYVNDLRRADGRVENPGV